MQIGHRDCEQVSKCVVWVVMLSTPFPLSSVATRTVLELGGRLSCYFKFKFNSNSEDLYLESFGLFGPNLDRPTADPFFFLG